MDSNYVANVDMKYLLFILMVVGCVGLHGQQEQSVQVVNFEELKARYQKDNDTVYVVNFWATWCGPCVAELPYFNKASKKLANEPVQFLFISLDYYKTLDTKVRKFLKKKPLEGEVLLLNDTDVNTWIPKVSDEWDGAIPVTLIRQGTKTKIINGAIESSDELLDIVKMIRK